MFDLRVTFPTSSLSICKQACVVSLEGLGEQRRREGVVAVLLVRVVHLFGIEGGEGVVVREGVGDPLLIGDVSLIAVHRHNTFYIGLQKLSEKDNKIKF